MIELIIAAIILATIGYQVDKPCDDQCFKEKIERETKKKR